MATINLYQSYNFLIGNPANSSWTQQQAPGLTGYSTGMSSTDGTSTESWGGIFQFPVHPELGGIQLAGGLIKTLQISQNGNQLLSGSDLTVDAFTRYINLNAGEGGKLGTWLNFDDTINGSSSNDVIMAYGGNDTIDGGGGIDTVVYAGNVREFSTWLSGGARFNRDNSSENGSEGTDTLINIERIQFSDAKIALDVTDNALETLQFIGVIAPSLQGNLSIRGQILSLFDEGKSMEEMSQLALDLGLITSDNTALAKTVFKNVFNTTADPDQGLTNTLVNFIEQNGDAKFLATVAGMNINVDLVGLLQHGMEYM